MTTPDWAWCSTPMRPWREPQGRYPLSPRSWCVARANRTHYYSTASAPPGATLSHEQRQAVVSQRRPALVADLPADVLPLVDRHAGRTNRLRVGGSVQRCLSTAELRTRVVLRR